MYHEIKEKFNKLEKQLTNPEINKNRQELIKVSQEHANLKKIFDLIIKLEKLEKDYKNNLDLINKEKDHDLINLAEEENQEITKNINKLKKDIQSEISPKNPNDKKNAIVEIRAGAGGDEGAIFAADLSQMYLKYCEKNSWKVEIINQNIIGIGGYKEIIFHIKGEGAYGALRFEAGTHRVQRVPDTEKQGRVHTSTATVIVLPEAKEVDIKINNNDIRVDTFCSSGPGGQSVNTTQSAIRLTHLPTGITVSCQDQKSQHQNKDKAMQILRSRLLAKKEEERISKESAERKDQVGGGDRSDKIRTYNFPQDRITDHRISQSWHNINTILEGELDPIIETLQEKLN
jgi:peptide chain release factor 1